MTDDVSAALQRYVLVFDFCSSTSILEDLKDSKPELWRELLVEVRKFLVSKSASSGFELYKFVGDGWILIFDSACSVSDLLLFMKQLSQTYDTLLATMIEPVLSRRMRPLGITFGLEEGTVNRFKMDEDRRSEYIGRPINVASRLQAAIKTEDEAPQGKVLTSKHVLSKEKELIRKEYRTRPVVVDLGNVSGASRYEGILLSLTDKPHQDALRWEEFDFNLDNQGVCLPNDPLLDCTVEIEFCIKDDGGKDDNWFGIRFRGRGERDNYFDGYLVYVRKKGKLDVRSFGSRVFDLERSVKPPTDFVKLRASMIGERVSSVDE